MNRLMKTALGAFAAAVAFPSVADAATWAISTGDVNLRTGPSVADPVIATVPRDGHVRIFRCSRRGDWCHVAWHGVDGWMSGHFLAELRHRHRYVAYGDTYVPYGFYPDFIYSYGYGYGYDHDHGHFRRRFDHRYFDRDHHVVGVNPDPFRGHDGMMHDRIDAGQRMAGGAFDRGMRTQADGFGHTH